MTGALERLAAEAIRGYYEKHYRCSGHDIGPTVQWAAQRAFWQGVRRGVAWGWGVACVGFFLGRWLL